MSKRLMLVFWIALSTDEQRDCLRVTNNKVEAVKFAWEHFMI